MFGPDILGVSSSLSVGTLCLSNALQRCICNSTQFACGRSGETAKALVGRLSFGDPLRCYSSSTGQVSIVLAARLRHPTQCLIETLGFAG